MPGKIKHVMIGVGEPNSGGCASTCLDGRTLVFEDGSTEICENQSITRQKLNKIFSSKRYKAMKDWKFN
jgi:hypothetical protein